MSKIYIFIAICIFQFSSAQIIDFPDANFKSKLLQPNVVRDLSWNYILLDSNGNGEIEISEAQLVSGLEISNSNISDLTGISFFTGLQYLECNNNLLTSISIDQSNQLNYLDASNNLITSVDVNFADVTEYVNLSYNQLTDFSIQDAYYADGYYLDHNQLTNLNISNASFEYFSIAHNNLSSIAISGTVAIYSSGSFNSNQFSLLDLSNINLSYDCSVFLGNNTIDNVLFGSSPGNIYYSSQNSYCNLGNFSSVSDCDPEETGNVYINSSPNLTQLILKNGFNHTEVTCNEGGTIFPISALDLNITNCPQLSHICVDEAELTHIQSRINQLGLQEQVQVNSYCSFTPGAIYYMISGTTNFDNNENGCDIADATIPIVKFNISSTATSGVAIANSSGNFTIPVQQGTHTITPILENPTYFNVSPPSATFTFPSDSPFSQNFCITPNGIHHDLSITLIPIGAAVPGFNANYRVVIKNEGNQAASGTVNLTFDDSVLDFVSAFEGTASGNMVSIAFSDFEPFESRTYVITLNLNSPMEAPALNNGDILNFTATISTSITDETPANNTAALNQTVLNSMDPNHKTCVEGQTITPSMVGQYINYIIEFENVGTFPATNVVVKDRIDTSKFDVTTLVPIASSHNFVTRINNNKVEFIFENINLPFDDANNDGFVAFKIKTKPTLVLGDTFSNTASIYFDYNFPIITNTETTTIAALGKQDFEFDHYITLYPNPTSETLHLKKSAAISVSSINIYNMLGQQLIVIPNANSIESVDVSSLGIGSYFLKIQSDKGASIAKFVKQ